MSQTSIAYLIPQFPGQTHVFFWREIRALEAAGVKVAIHSTRLPPQGLIAHDWSAEAIARTRYLDRIRPDHALSTLLRVPPRHWRDDLRREGRALGRDLVLSLAAARQLVHSCRAQGIGHVHVHSCGRSALVAALARLMGGPSYSLTLHGPLHDYGPGQRLKWRHASFATVITEKLLSEVTAALHADLPARVMVQPMGVDTKELQRDTPYVPPRPGAPLRLFSCARLNRVKGHDVTLRALRRLVDRGMDVSLEIAGEDDAGGGGYSAELRRIRADLGLEDRVDLLGAIDGGEVKRRLCAADGFVLASLHEPLGVAYMEAMSCGVPTIGTDAGGVPELIRDGIDGVLVPPGDDVALARAIARVFAAPEDALRLARAGRARIVAQFDSARGAETIRNEVARLAP